MLNMMDEFERRWGRIDDVLRGLSELCTATSMTRCRHGNSTSFLCSSPFARLLWFSGPGQVQKKVSKKCIVASRKAQNEGCDTEFFALSETRISQMSVVGFDFDFGVLW